MENMKGSFRDTENKRGVYRQESNTGQTGVLIRDIGKNGEQEIIKRKMFKNL